MLSRVIVGVMTNKQNKLKLSRFYPFSLCLTLIIQSPAHAGSLYKWIDENGLIRYSDHLPVDQATKRHQTLAPDGRVLETMEAPKPPEQSRQERAERLRQEYEARIRADKEAQIRAEREHHDTVLMMTFSKEVEIVDAQKERVSIIDSVILLLKKNIEHEKKNLALLEQGAKILYLEQNQEVPGGLAQKIEYFTEKLLSKQNQLELKIAERNKVINQYALDLVRYRELSEQQNNP